MKAHLMYMLGSYKASLLGASILVFVVITALQMNVAEAESPLPCGNIIAPNIVFGPDSPLVTTPITDCQNPFSVTAGVESSYSLTIEGQVVTPGISIQVPDGGTDNFVVEGSPLEGGVVVNHMFMQHDGNDYRYFDTRELDVTESDYRSLALEFFPTGTDVEPYVETLVSGDYSLSDPEMQSALYDFLDYFDVHFSPKYPKLRAGTYTLVSKESQFILSKQTFSEKLFAYVIPTAHAQTYTDNVFALTFTIAETPTVPSGASSVLFLPGIQASRLYKEGLFGSEDQLWEPNINNDVKALAMDELGVSVNEVYTRDVVDEIFGVTNVYQSFLDVLENLKSEGVITDFSAFAYDWRYDVTDIAKNGTHYESKVKSLVSEIERLSTTSFTHRVTIIGHSNGGLLGKALITELEAQGKADLVDKLVMIGTPQLGAPKAVAVMLHGYDQLVAMGHIIDDDTARSVIRNMPGAYTLLPSAEYFQKANETLITADTSSTTASIRAYGPVSSRQLLDNLLLDSQNQRNDTVPIYEPSTLNSLLLQRALVTGNSLDEWLPPEGIDVYEIIGTGNPTIKAFEYQSFPCYVGFAVQCTTGTYMKAVPVFTNNGDETVTTLSAGGQDGEKVTGYIDLALEGQQLLVSRREHMNLTESPTVQTFVDSIIKYPYLAPALAVPEFTSVSRVYKVIGVHSPVSLFLTDSTGKQVGVVNGVIKEDIAGAQYLELGDSKYVIVPDDVFFTANIKGEAMGVYSLTVDKLMDSSQTHIHRYIGASTTPSMHATFTFTNNTFSNIVTDLNGDGTIDTIQTLDGQAITPPVVYSYSLLKANIKALLLPKRQEVVLLLLVDSASYWDALTPSKPAYQRLERAALDTQEATLKIYKQKRYITQEQFATLGVIIHNLKN